MVDLESWSDAQAAPTPYVVFALIYNGRLLSDHQISRTHFRHIMEWISAELSGWPVDPATGKPLEINSENRAAVRGIVTLQRVIPRPGRPDRRAANGRRVTTNFRQDQGLRKARSSARLHDSRFPAS